MTYLFFYVTNSTTTGGLLLFLHLEQHKFDVLSVISSNMILPLSNFWNFSGRKQYWLCTCKKFPDDLHTKYLLPQFWLGRKMPQVPLYTTFCAKHNARLGLVSFVLRNNLKFMIYIWFSCHAKHSCVVLQQIVDAVVANFKYQVHPLL